RARAHPNVARDRCGLGSAAAARHRGRGRALLLDPADALRVAGALQRVFTGQARRGKGVMRTYVLLPGSETRVCNEALEVEKPEAASVSARQRLRRGSSTQRRQDDEKGNNFPCEQLRS